VHNLRSEFETLHIDAVKEWHKVVEAARRADVIFNCIDHGTPPHGQRVRVCEVVRVRPAVGCHCD
jgi:hypothetical protein